MCVPIKQNLQDYAAHSIIEDTQLLYHNFRKLSSGKEKIFSVRLVRPGFAELRRGKLVRPGFAELRRGKLVRLDRQKKNKKGLLKYELAFTFSGNTRGDPR